jgi:transposase
MAEQANWRIRMGTVQSSAAAVESKDGKRRRFRSKQERRQIVEETLKPGASVSLVARAHDVNTNQVFNWRKLYQEGRLEVAPSTSTLLPVKISDAPAAVDSGSERRPVKTRRPGVIDIDLGHARVRIEGAADPDCIRAALEGLIR